VREIRYRGGMLTFLLPDEWQEEQFPDGGAEFFTDDRDAGTLNLALTTMQKDEGATETNLREVVTSGAKAGDSPEEKLPSGSYLRRYERSEIEEQQPLHLTYWMVANAVPPKTVRLAAFGFAVAAERAGSAEHQQLVQLLDEQIRAVEFTKWTPEQIRAARRPWWKFWE
jgi:hypothetical protein